VGPLEKQFTTHLGEHDLNFLFLIPSYVSVVQAPQITANPSTITGNRGTYFFLFFSPTQPGTITVTWTGVVTPNLNDTIAGRNECFGTFLKYSDSGCSKLAKGI
jgi:hypothetical protein